MNNFSIDIQIKPNDSLSPPQLQEIDALLKLAFKDEVDSGFDWDQPGLHVTASDSGKLISHVGILFRQIQVGSQMVRVGGISDVGTHPDWRCRGIAHILLKAAGEYLRKDGKYQFAMLFCNESLIHYYASLAYKKVDAPLFITSRGKHIQINEIKMILPFFGNTWPEGEIDLLGLPW
jgi:GNAT superfamily N-acetyltransferase